MKKLTSLLAVMVLVGSALVGCAKPEEGDPAKTTSPTTTETKTDTTKAPEKDAADGMSKSAGGEGN